MTDRGWGTQLVRYAVIGVTTNAAAYLCYLALTYAGLWPTAAMTIVYVACASLGYMANRRLTFSHKGDMLSSGARFLLAQAMGYAVNAMILLVFVDHLRYPHRWVQAAAIFVVAPILFLAMKFFVFRRTDAGDSRVH